eukprot:CAMPEP_0204009050 /NCGR_PEP_ID=MMETSP0360-20130528/21581_1 /ASSEMBLY_ACC=CAM_ASM_000342 /TAXON_ID=268821 /ORGANISM="Scrippsiella Hangoei, Strain SHTV-5" /LENGTH=45 /DNA_ID= /DNA_START= /DNA_END= /DNA_ORIENTATION=
MNEAIVGPMDNVFEVRNWLFWRRMLPISAFVAASPPSLLRAAWDP